MERVQNKWRSLFVWAKSFLPTYILNLLGDRMEMAHSIDGRVPFLDHRVVECLCRVPVSLKIRGMTEKYLLRQAARPVITDTVYRRQKHPFLSPPVTTAPTERFHQMLQDTLRSAVLTCASPDISSGSRQYRFVPAGFSAIVRVLMRMILLSVAA